MDNYAGYWTGEMMGTNPGGLTLDIKQEGARVHGVGKFHEPSLGYYEYVIEGEVGDELSLNLVPGKVTNGLTLGDIRAVGKLESENSVRGRWKSSIGTEGVFKVERFSAEKIEASLPKTNSVFVVHGHDEGAKQSVARFIEKLGLEPVILAEQINRGMTVLEKFEEFASRAGYAIILITPDDKGYPVGKEEAATLRARQNVILELGYFVAKLGRAKNFVLTKGEVELPSDVFGLVYEKLDDGEGWKMRLAKELKESGFQIDMNSAI